MRTPTLVLAIALGIVSPAAASPIYQYGFNFSDGTHSVSGIVTLAPYDFSPALASDICGACDPNAILTDFEFTTYDIGGAALAGGIDTHFTMPAASPTYVNYFTLDADGVILDGRFDKFSPCDLDCLHMEIMPGDGFFFAAHATVAEGIIDEVFLRGSVDVVPLPEPGSVALLSTGLVGFLSVRRRRRAS